MSWRAAGRHVDLLVPFEQRRGALKVDDFADGELEACEGLVHSIQGYWTRPPRSNYCACFCLRRRSLAPTVASPAPSSVSEAGSGTGVSSVSVPSAIET